MRRVSFVLLAICLASPAVAEEAIKVEVVSKALQGQDEPGLIVRAETAIARIVLDVERSTDHRRLKQAAGPLRPGRSHRFPLSLTKPGSARFTGKLSVEIDDGQSGEMPIDVEVSLLAPLVLTIARDDVDLDGRKLRLAANRDVKRVQITLMSDSGAPLGTTEKSWDGNLQPAGQPIAVEWEQKKGTVMRITVQAWDESEFFGAVELYPWRVDIPHEEVNFATNSFDIADSETKKLDASYGQIKAAIDKYGALATIRLFIAGHTDTVGDNASNRVLSNNRARSLGRWFIKRGVKIPVLYAGFGEDKLLVETPDQTDEAKNRRAEYIVAVDAPPIKGGAGWEKLQ